MMNSLPDFKLSNIWSKGAELAQTAYELGQKAGIIPPGTSEMLATTMTKVAETAENVKDAAQNLPQAAIAIEAVSDTAHTVMGSETWNGVVESALTVFENEALKTVIEITQTIIETVEKHPETTAVAIAAALVAINPELIVLPVLNAIGIGPEGPIIGTLATAWQSTYGGLVPRGSFFSLCQKAAMGGGGALLTGVSAVSVLIVVASFAYMRLQDDKAKADIIAALETLPKPWESPQAEAIYEKAKTAADNIFSAYEAANLGSTPIIEWLSDSASAAVAEAAGYVRGFKENKNEVD